MIVYALSVGDVLRGPPVLGDNCPSHCIGDPIRIYRLESRPVRVGPVVTALTPLAFTDRVAVLILPPRLHRHLCEGGVGIQRTAGRFATTPWRGPGCPSRALPVEPLPRMPTRVPGPGLSLARRAFPCRLYAIP